MGKVKPAKNYQGVEHGWLLPNGLLYACGYLGHNDLSEQLGGAKNHWAMEDGWVKLHSYRWYGSYGITQRQLDVIWDYCRANETEFPKGEFGVTEYAEERDGRATKEGLR